MSAGEISSSRVLARSVAMPVRPGSAVSQFGPKSAPVLGRRWSSASLDVDGGSGRRGQAISRVGSCPRSIK